MEKVDVVFEQSEKVFYDETQRAERMRDLAEKMIAAVAVVVGFQLIEIDSLLLVSTWQETLRAGLAICALTTLSTSLVLAFLGMQIGESYGPPRGMALINELKDSALTDDMAKIMIAKMYLEAYEINGGINDRRARRLVLGCTLLIVGFILAVASYLMGSVTGA